MTTAPAVGAAFCPRCGMARPPGARFCPGCGLDLTVVVAGGPPPVPMWPAAAPTAPMPPGTPPVGAGPLVAAVPPAVPGALGPLPAGAVTGRRASGAGWVLAIGGALVFLVAAMGVIAFSDRVLPGSASSSAPLARWDRMITNPGSVRNLEPFDIGAEAVNGAAAATDQVWMVIDWRPDDLALDADAEGRLAGCEPADCSYRDDVDAGRTLVYWPPLAAGERHAYSVTVAVRNLDAGETFVYRVTTGTGPDERSIDGGHTWSLDADVE